MTLRHVTPLDGLLAGGGDEVELAGDLISMLDTVIRVSSRGTRNAEMIGRMDFRHSQ